MLHLAESKLIHAWFSRYGSARITIPDDILGDTDFRFTCTWVGPHEGDLLLVLSNELWLRWTVDCEVMDGDRLGGPSGWLELGCKGLFSARGRLPQGGHVDRTWPRGWAAFHADGDYGSRVLASSGGPLPR